MLAHYPLCLGPSFGGSSGGMYVMGVGPRSLQPPWDLSSEALIAVRWQAVAIVP